MAERTEVEYRVLHFGEGGTFLDATACASEEEARGEAGRIKWQHVGTTTKIMRITTTTEELP